MAELRCMCVQDRQRPKRAPSKPAVQIPIFAPSGEEGGPDARSITADSRQSSSFEMLADLAEQGASGSMQQQQQPLSPRQSGILRSALASSPRSLVRLLPPPGCMHGYTIPPQHAHLPCPATGEPQVYARCTLLQCSCQHVCALHCNAALLKSYPRPRPCALNPAFTAQPRTTTATPSRLGLGRLASGRGVRFEDAPSLRQPGSPVAQQEP